VLTGQPIGLLTQSGTLYVPMPEEHDPRREGGVDAKASASDHMGHIVEVNGTEASVAHIAPSTSRDLPGSPVRTATHTGRTWECAHSDPRIRFANPIRESEPRT
jgi:hypothetical protein